MEQILIVAAVAIGLIAVPASVVLSAMAYKVGVTLLGKGSELQES